MKTDALGKKYEDGELIVQQGDVGDCMYIIQSGQVEVIQRQGDKEFCLALLSEGEFFGEMALFEREVRCATVRALGEVRVLTVDKKTFLRRVHEDPSLAFGILQKMSHRIRELDRTLVRIATDQTAASVPVEAFTNTAGESK